MNFGFGHGAVDFAGSGVVHMCGGMIAIAGGLCIGPRLGKYGPDGKPRPIPGHDIPMVMLGTFILALGWFGFNPGSTLAGTDNRIAIVAVNTMLAGAAASVGTLFTMYLVTGKPDPSMLCNGLLAGLVAITAPCAFVEHAGRGRPRLHRRVIVVFSVFFWERTAKIDDCVGAISVHGVCGCWGVLSVGLFANGSYGAGWGGVHKLFKDGAWTIINNDATPGDVEEVRGHDRHRGDRRLDRRGCHRHLRQVLRRPRRPISRSSARSSSMSASARSSCSDRSVSSGSRSRTSSSRSVPSARMKSSGLDIPEMGAEAYPDFQITDKSFAANCMMRR